MMSNLEIIAFFLSLLGVWLTTKQNQLCWLVNGMAVILYLVVFYRVQLYADVLLHVVFIMMQIYGWYSWSKIKQGQALVVAKISHNVRINSLGLAITAGVLFGAGLAHYSDASVPWLDAMLATFSLAASYWAAKKYLESWLLWCVIDVIYIGMYLYKDLYLTAFLYFIFIGLALYGWRLWRAQYTQQSLQHATVS